MDRRKWVNNIVEIKDLTWDGVMLLQVKYMIECNVYTDYKIEKGKLYLLFGNMYFKYDLVDQTFEHI